MSWSRRTRISRSAYQRNAPFGHDLARLTPDLCVSQRATILLFFVFAHLLGQIALVSQFFDHVHLGFEKVDVVLFVFQ
jgi:hypothetical protein